ncbi:hypothetical protein GVAV_000940 [Gurleya vavrai]
MSNNCIKLINKYIYSELVKYIRKSSDALIFYFVSIIKTDKNFDLIEIVIEIVSNFFHLETICDLYFLSKKENLNFVDKVMKINYLSGYELYYQIFLDFDIKLINQACEQIISRNNNLQDLDLVLIIAFKTEKFHVFGNVLKNLKQFLGQTIALCNYELIYKKLDFKYDLDYEGITKLASFSLIESFVNFFIYMKKYEIASFYTNDDNIKFYCFLKLKDLKKAQKIIDLKNVELNKKNLFKFYLLTKQQCLALNILEEIRDPMIFNKLLKKAYKNNNLFLIKEGIVIGLKNFGCSNFELLKIFISFLHIDEIQINFEEKNKMLIEIIENINLENVYFKDKEWLFNLVYNNTVDCIKSKDEIIFKFLEISVKLVSYNNDLIFLYLNAYKSNLINDKQTNIEFLFGKYKENKQKNFSISILFFELDCNSEILSFFRPIKNLNEKKLLKLIIINSKHINFKIELFNLIKSKNLINEKIFLKILFSIALYGPQSLFSFLSSIEWKEYKNKKVESFLIKQIEILKITGNFILANKFDKFLLI